MMEIKPLIFALTADYSPEMIMKVEKHPFLKIFNKIEDYQIDLINQLLQ